MTPGWPPPQAIASPLMADDNGDARKTIIVAMSAAVTMRPMVVIAANRSSMAGGSTPSTRARAANVAGVASVTTVDGCTRVTLIPDGPSSSARFFGHRRDGHISDRADGRPGTAGGQAAHIDDPPPSSSHHRGSNSLRTTQVAHDLDVDIGPEGLGSDLGQGGRPGLSARGRCGVDEDVDAAHGRHGLGEH